MLRVGFIHDLGVYYQQFKRPSFNKFKMELLRMQKYQDKFLKSELKPYVPNLATVASNPTQSFGRKRSHQAKFGANPISNAASSNQQYNDVTILPDIKATNGIKKPKIVSEKRMNIRKSFDDNENRSTIGKVDDDQNDAEIMRTIISNYLDLDSKTEAGNDTLNPKHYSRSVNSRNKQVKLKVINNSVERKPNKVFLDDNSHMGANKTKQSFGNNPVSASFTLFSNPEYSWEKPMILRRKLSQTINLQPMQQLTL